MLGNANLAITSSDGNSFSLVSMLTVHVLVDTQLQLLQVLIVEHIVSLPWACLLLNGPIALRMRSS